MTPGINAAKKAGIAFSIHEYIHEAGAPSYGLEAAEKLGLPPEQVFKTLVTQLDHKQLIVAIVPVACTLDLKALAAACGGKKAEMADVHEAEKATGYVAGGISPLGQKKKLKTVLDASALAQEKIFVSAGRRGLEIALAPNDLLKLCGGISAAIARH
ncbi:MAG: Cys-tRNA(Pro) deacylase [Pedobacter sp.]|nr:Cys-tRNA(Pro) deacylase [Pedobacter sp.]